MRLVLKAPIARNKDNIEAGAHVPRAQAYAAKDDTRASENSFKRALALQPVSAEPAIGLAKPFVNGGLLSEAMKPAKKLKQRAQMEIKKLVDANKTFKLADAHRDLIQPRK